MEKEKTRLEQQTDFILEIDKEKNILRQTHLTGKGRRENDAEHAWHMAVMAYLLREYANQEVDLLKVILMCLTHDVVEIDAGDTYAYDTAALATQKQREQAAKERIYALLPPDQQAELTALFEEFEENATPEAHFAHALDNFQPLLLNQSNDGMDWVLHKAQAGPVFARHSMTRAGSETLYQQTLKILEENVEKGRIGEQEQNRGEK